MQRLKDAAKARLFRISSDDNIVFLQEIAQSQPESVFDHPYLELYRRAHEKYGAKVVLNLFYDNSTSRGFEKDRGDFDLSMMPDCYKTEWAQNADWLKFSFHALREFPEFPYRTADGETVFADAEKCIGKWFVLQAKVRLRILRRCITGRLQKAVSPR